MGRDRRAGTGIALALCFALALCAVAGPAAAAADGDAALNHKAPVHVLATAVRHHVVLTRTAAIAAARHTGFERVAAAAPEGVRGEEPGALEVRSSVALVIEDKTSNVLFSRNSDVALPIASITKLMTSLVVLEARQPMEEPLEITEEDLDTEKNTTSRLIIGTILSRRDLMHLALMSSENRAAHALCRSYPGGLGACLEAMNNKALQLGMLSTHFNDPTGLSSQNVASAEDLAKLLEAASQNATIREFSTDAGYTVPVGRRMVAFRNTNSLVTKPGWDIAVQKTGYIVEAGKCLVMKARIEGKSVLIVLLDSVGKYTRFGDANRIKKWMESNPPLFPATPALIKSDAPRVTS
jgi:D-alanyl-D-alanine endopeptidase (penicillin-binding protein 7)